MPEGPLTGVGDSNGLLPEGTLTGDGDSNGFVLLAFASGESKGLCEFFNLFVGWRGDGVDPNGLIRFGFDPGDGVYTIRLPSLGLGFRLAGLLSAEYAGESKGFVVRFFAGGRFRLMALCELMLLLLPRLPLCAE